MLTEGALAGLESGWSLIQERYEQLSGDIERPILPPEMAFWTPQNLRAGIKQFPRLELTSHELEVVDDTRFNAQTAHPLSTATAKQQDVIARWLEPTTDVRTLLVTSSPGLSLIHI